MACANSHSFDNSTTLDSFVMLRINQVEDINKRGAFTTLWFRIGIIILVIVIIIIFVVSVVKVVVVLI